MQTGFARWHTMLVRTADSLVSNSWGRYRKATSVSIFIRCTFPASHKEWDPRTNQARPDSVRYKKDMDAASTRIGQEDAILHNTFPPTHRRWFRGQTGIHGHSSIPWDTMHHRPDAHLITQLRDWDKPITGSLSRRQDMPAMLHRTKNWISSSMPMSNLLWNKRLLLLPLQRGFWAMNRVMNLEDERWIAQTQRESPTKNT